MKFKSKWVYNYAKGLAGSMVSCDCNIENDDLFFAFTSGFARMESVLLKLNLHTQECRILFKENHVLRTAGVLENRRSYLTSMKGMAYCISDSGEMIWATRLGDNPQASFKVSLDRNHFYVSNYTMFCLDKQSGEILWKNEKYTKKVNCNILIQDNYLYCGELGGKVFCLDKTTGETVWEFGNNEWITNIEMISEDRLLVNHCHGWFYILDAKTGDEIKKISANGRLYAKPVIEKNRLYVGDQNNVMDATEGNLTCYEISKDNSLTEQFKFTANGAVSSNILICENKLFFGAESGYLYCIDKITGQELISKKKCKGACRNIILKDQNLIIISDKSQVECLEIV